MQWCVCGCRGASAPGDKRMQGINSCNHVDNVVEFPDRCGKHIYTAKMQLESVSLSADGKTIKGENEIWERLK